MLALDTLRDKGITLAPEMQCFLVKTSISGKKYVVTLFPKETCQCPSTARCNHIIMARIAIALDADDRKKKDLNLDVLRKNTRPRKFKKSGRKRPFDGDLNHIEVKPAPDAIMNKSLNEIDFYTDKLDCESSISHSTPKNKTPKLPKTPCSILKTLGSISKKNFDDKFKKSF